MQHVALASCQLVDTERIKIAASIMSFCKFLAIPVHGTSRGLLHYRYIQ